MERLNIDEVMALQMTGLSTSKIRKTDVAEFHRLYTRNSQMKEYLNKANNLLDRQEKLGIVSISCQDRDFPKRFLAIGDDCPAVIHCKGNVSLLNAEKVVAIIGARSADRIGNLKAYQLAMKYVRDGYVIVSGLALGCDTAAHRGCLDAKGNTVAIVGNGLDIVHPRENKVLENDILENGGLILSEQLIGTKANANHLVARNRLQAALSENVILAQCPAQSGSLHTMRFARKYHKQSFVVTFRQRTTTNAGNHILLDQGLANEIEI